VTSRRVDDEGPHEFETPAPRSHWTRKRDDSGPTVAAFESMSLLGAHSDYGIGGGRLGGWLHMGVSPRRAKKRRSQLRQKDFSLSRLVKHGLVCYGRSCKVVAGGTRVGLEWKKGIARFRESTEGGRSMVGGGRGVALILGASLRKDYHGAGHKPREAMNTDSTAPGRV